MPTPAATCGCLPPTSGIRPHPEPTVACGQRLSCCAALPRPPNRQARKKGASHDRPCPHLAAYLRNHLPRERRFSRHTVQTDTESFKRLVLFAAERLDIRPCPLLIEHFTVALPVAFIECLEMVRHNSVGTRHTRLVLCQSLIFG